MTSPLSAAALVALLIAGCASSGDPAQTSSNEPRPERVYRTGSNIPFRDPQPLTKEEKKRQAEEAKRALARRPGV
jgi:hypothetical protein